MANQAIGMIETKGLCALFEATDAAFRMAIGRNTVVDNFHAGGIAAAVEIAAPAGAGRRS